MTIQIPIALKIKIGTYIKTFLIIFLFLWLLLLGSWGLLFFGLLLGLLFSLLGGGSSNAGLELCVLLGVELSHLLTEGHSSDNFLDLGLVDDGAEPTVDVAV